MVQPNDLIAKFKFALDNKWGYIWGQWGAVWTQAKQRQKVNYMVSKYGENWKNSASAKDDNYYYAAMYGSKWIGVPVADCSGLFRWAFDQFGIAYSHSSNRIWEGWCTSQGTLQNGRRTDGKILLPGTAVFVHPKGKNRTHIGLYVGNNMVIESSGTQAGVVQSLITHKKWVEWGELKHVSYSGGGDEPIPVGDPTLKRGDNGDYVKLAQKLLIEQGYSLDPYGADGQFGKVTEGAVKRFQQDHGLITDGIIGQSTWDVLRNPQPVTLLYTVNVPHLTKYQAEALVKQYFGANMIEERK